MAVVFGERPDSRTSARMLLSYGIIMTVSLLAQRPRDQEETMKNHFEGATPEALAKALLRPTQPPRRKRTDLIRTSVVKRSSRKRQGSKFD